MRLNPDLNTAGSHRLPANKRWNNVTRIHEDLKSNPSIATKRDKRVHLRQRLLLFENNRIEAADRKPQQNRIFLYTSAYLSGTVMHQLITTDAPLPSKRGRRIEWNSFARSELCRNSRQINCLHSWI